MDCAAMCSSLGNDDGELVQHDSVSFRDRLSVFSHVLANKSLFMQ